jgi:hypothetical protein
MPRNPRFALAVTRRGARTLGSEVGQDRGLLRCTVDVRIGSKCEILMTRKCLPLYPNNRTLLPSTGTSGLGQEAT